MKIRHFFNYNVYWVLQTSDPIRICNDLENPKCMQKRSMNNFADTKKNLL